MLQETMTRDRPSGRWQDYVVPQCWESLSDDDHAVWDLLFARQVDLLGTRIVSAETIRRFTTVQDSTLSNRALGWETPNGANSAGHLLTRPAFGHTGFTGTSIWVDPSRDLFVILLTNRVNPTRQNLRIGAVRTALADVVVRVLDRSQASSPSPTSPR